jgi:hypothetical protein
MLPIAMPLESLETFGWSFGKTEDFRHMEIRWEALNNEQWDGVK